MAPHSSVLAWKIPWTEEPGRLQSEGLQSRTNLSDSAHRKEIQILGNKKKVRCLFLSPFPLLLTESLPDASVLLVAGSLIFSSRLP